MATDDVWQKTLKALTPEERQSFESLKCDNPEGYVGKLREACQKHKDESTVFRVFDWFEPLCKAVDLFTGAATVALAPHPNPGSIVLGGIIAEVQSTARL